MSSPSKEDLPKVPSAIKNELTSFDSSKMKHAETQEKNPLPSKEGSRARRVLIRRGNRSMSKDEPTPEASKANSPFSYSNLKSAADRKVQPTTPVVKKTELGQLLDSIRNFSKSNLKRVETTEKNALPTKQDVEEEKKQKRTFNPNLPPPPPPPPPPLEKSNAKTPKPSSHVDKRVDLDKKSPGISRTPMEEIIQNINSFSLSKLRPTKTVEKNLLPSKEDIDSEKGQQKHLQGIQSFGHSQLKHADTQEKNVLPSKEDVKQEKIHREIKMGVENFNKKKLKRTKTEEKLFLPDAQDIESERASGTSPPLPPPPPPVDSGCKTLSAPKEHQRSKSPMRLKIPPPVEAKGGDLLSQFLAGIESFSRNHLRPTKTKEKNVLPSKEDIDCERRGGRRLSPPKQKSDEEPSAIPQSIKRSPTLRSSRRTSEVPSKENPPSERSPTRRASTPPRRDSEKPSVAVDSFPTCRETTPPRKDPEEPSVEIESFPTTPRNDTEKPSSVVQVGRSPTRRAPSPPSPPHRPSPRRDSEKLSAAVPPPIKRSPTRPLKKKEPVVEETNPEEDAMLEEELKQMLDGKDIEQLIQEFLQGDEETKPKPSTQMLERIKSCTHLVDKQDDDDDESEEEEEEESSEEEDDETPVASPMIRAPWMQQTPVASSQKAPPWPVASPSPLRTPGPASQVRLIPVQVERSDSSEEETESEEEEDTKKVVTAVNVRLQNNTPGAVSPKVVTSAAINLKQPPDSSKRKIVYRGFKAPN